MSDSEPVLGILLTHGEMAKGMVDALARIAGTGSEAVVPVSNEGRSPEQLEGELDRLMGERRAIVFTDLRSGSCALVARMVCRPGRDRAAVFGVNLAMLLDFVFHRELELGELVPRLLRKGGESVRAVPEVHSHADPPVSR